LDQKQYRDMVQAMYARQKAITDPNGAAARDLELFIKTIERLRVSWRDPHPGSGVQPHAFFTGQLGISTDGSEATCERIWPELFLDDGAAARAALGTQVVDMNACVRSIAQCCKAERPVVGTLSVCSSTSLQTLPVGCFATLCHTCLKVSPLKI
jgi:hypothetical protein